MTRSMFTAALVAFAVLAACGTPAPLSPEQQRDRRAQEVDDTHTEDAVQRIKDEFNTLHPDG